MKWNFVEDKLPKLVHKVESYDGGYFLCSDRVLVAGSIDSVWFSGEPCDMATAKFCVDYDENGKEEMRYWSYGFDCDGSTLESKDIVAWMPLPSPPMEKRP